MDIEDLVKIILIYLFIVFVGFFGYLSWFLYHNAYGLGWGITCSIAFVVITPFTIGFAIWCAKEKKKENEK